MEVCKSEGDGTIELQCGERYFVTHASQVDHACS